MTSSIMLAAVRSAPQETMASPAALELICPVRIDECIKGRRFEDELLWNINCSFFVCDDDDDDDAYSGSR